MLNSSSQICQVDPIDISLFWRNVLIILYSSVGFSAIVGNLSVILIIICKRSMQTVPNIFICSLSIANIIITISSLWATPMYYYLKTWLWKKSMCYVVNTVQGASLMWVSYTLAALAIDRYRKVVSPFSPTISIQTCFMVILIICFFSLIILSPMLYHVIYVELPCHRFCFEDWYPHEEYRFYYGICVLLVRSAIPLGIISWCNWKITTCLEKQRKKFRAINRLRHRNICRKQKLQKILKGMVFVFAVSSVPLDAFNVIQDFSIFWRLKIIAHEYNNFFFFFSHWLAMSGTLLNPLIYAYLNRNFRHQTALLCGQQKATLMAVIDTIRPHSMVKNSSRCESEDLQNPRTI